MIAHDEIVKLVAQVNGALALLSCPFVLYDVLTKNPSIISFQDRVQLKRDKLMGLVVLDMADRLRPYLPQRASKIIIEPEFRTEESSSLSDEAIEEMKECLESHERVIGTASSLKTVASRVLTMDKWMYSLIFLIAVESIGALASWVLMKQMGHLVALAFLAIPLFTAFLALVCAGLRQRLIYRAQTLLVSEERHEG